ncbi:MAG: anti-sigma factor family protein [Gemmobacter sp.]
MTDHPQTPIHSDEEGDAMLMALADGELAPGDAGPLLARVAADPALARRFEVFVTTRSLMRDAYDAGPVPDRLIQSILGAPDEAAPKVVPFALRRRAVLAPMALAASLVLALGVGGFLGARDPAQVAGQPAEIAAAALAGMQTGGETTFAGGVARVLGSYQTDIGPCRLIAVTSADGRTERAVVCKEETGWSAVLALTTGAAGVYVPAADAAVELVDGFLDQIGAGPALSPEEEAAAFGN